MVRYYSDFDFFIMWERMSMGSGKTIVEFFSADIVFSVCKEAEVQLTPSFTQFSPEERQLYFTHGRGSIRRAAV